MRWYRSKFTESAEFSQPGYRDSRRTKLFDLLDKKYWPEELRRHRNRLDRQSGVPHWFVAANNNIVLSAQGLQEWKDVVLPMIGALTR